MGQLAVFSIVSLKDGIPAFLMKAVPFPTCMKWDHFYLGFKSFAFSHFLLE